MMEEVFGCTTPLSAATQRDSFNALVEETLGDDCAYDTVLEIHEKLNDLIESQKDEPEPVVLTKSEVKRLFEECGVEDEKLQNFDEQYELAAGEKSSLVASNITNTRKFEIKTPDVVIHVAPDRRRPGRNPDHRRPQMPGDPHGKRSRTQRHPCQRTEFCQR